MTRRPEHMDRNPVEAFRALDRALSRMAVIKVRDNARSHGQPSPAELLAFIEAGEEAVMAWAELTGSDAAEDLEALLESRGAPS